MPGVTMRNVSENRASCGLASLLSVCQAMSMAMTTVLPEPVAIFKASAEQAGVRRVVGLAEPVLNPGVAVFPRHLGDVDGRFQGFDLAEEELLLAVWGRSSRQAAAPWWA